MQLIITRQSTVRTLLAFALIGLIASTASIAQQPPACEGDAILTAKSCEGDGLDSVEQELFNKINDYRKQNGLPEVAFSPSLTLVANRRVRDQAINLKKGGHDWSNCSYAQDGNCMWRAPERLGTPYTGNGYEVVCERFADTISPQEALECWQGSKGHKAVILNQQAGSDSPDWGAYTWRAMGVGIYKGYAALWFGADVDSAAAPPPPTSTQVEFTLALPTGIQAQDIGAGADGAVWYTDSADRIWRVKPGQTKGEEIGGAAKRVAAVGTNQAWVVNAGGEIYKWTGTTWEQKPGQQGQRARDIGVGSDGTAWIIGTDTVGGGHNILQWNGSAWTQIDGGAVRIAVEPQGSPWVVNDVGNIYQRTASGWQQMPGKARDIGIGADGTVWIIGTDTVGGGYGIYRMAPNGSNWVQQPGGAVAISVGGTDTAWVVNDAGNVYKWPTADL